MNVISFNTHTKPQFLDLLTQLVKMLWDLLCLLGFPVLAQVLRIESLLNRTNLIKQEINYNYGTPDFTDLDKG